MKARSRPAQVGGDQHYHLLHQWHPPGHSTVHSCSQRILIVPNTVDPGKFCSCPQCIAETVYHTALLLRILSAVLGCDRQCSGSELGAWVVSGRVRARAAFRASHGRHIGKAGHSGVGNRQDYLH